MSDALAFAVAFGAVLGGLYVLIGAGKPVGDFDLLLLVWTLGWGLLSLADGAVAMAVFQFTLSAAVLLRFDDATVRPPFEATVVDDYGRPVGMVEITDGPPWIRTGKSLERLYRGTADG